MNIVKLKYKNDEYVGTNNFHPEWCKLLANVVFQGKYSGRFPGSFNISGAVALSLHPNHALTPPALKDGSEITTSAAVSIYAFKEPENALYAVGENVDINTFILHPLIFSGFSSDVSYSVSSVDKYSFLINQKFSYVPETDDNYVTINIGSLSVKLSYVYTIPGRSLYLYLPLVYTTAEKLVGDKYIFLDAGETIDIFWLVNFNFLDNIKSNLKLGNVESSDKNENIISNIHNSFKTTLKDILCSENYTWAGSDSDIATKDNLLNFKINNIIAYEFPNDALKAGSDGTILSSSISSLSLYQDYLVNYRIKYKNITNYPKKIGSLLLSGYIYNNKPAVPISWINASSVWGQDIKVVEPGETIDLSWTLDFTPSSSVQKTETERA